MSSQVTHGFESSLGWEFCSRDVIAVDISLTGPVSTKLAIKLTIRKKTTTTNFILLNKFLKSVIIFPRAWISKIYEIYYNIIDYVSSRFRDREIETLLIFFFFMYLQ